MNAGRGPEQLCQQMLLLPRVARLPVAERQCWRPARRLMLLMQQHLRVGQKVTLQMVDKMRGGEGRIAFAPAQRIAVGTLRPRRPGRRQQQQPAARAERADQRGERFAVKPVTGVKMAWRNSCPSRLRRAEGGNASAVAGLAERYPLSRKRYPPLLRLLAAPLCLAG